MEGDGKLLEELCEHISAKIVFSPKSTLHKIKDSGDIVHLELKSGYSIETTYSKLLYSDKCVNMRDGENIDKAIKVFERDLNFNEKGNPAIKINIDDTYGPNILVWYDGSVSFGWQSEMPDLGLNIYKHDYYEIKNVSLSDPGTLATIENGFKYRTEIINEVNPKAVIRSKAINIRDFASPILLEEDKTKVYYCIRVIQDYIKTGRITPREVKDLPLFIQTLVNKSRKSLKNLYNESNFDIVEQYIEEDPVYFKNFVNNIKIYSQQKDINIFKEYFRKNSNINQYILEKWLTLFSLHYSQTQISTKN